jgi:preprotein translocase subunit SecG
METVILMIHLVLAILLIAVVLLQRSEGGALGIGGGGGGLVSARGAATALSKTTWALAIGFICTSLALTIMASDLGPSSVFDQAGDIDSGAIPLPALPTEGGGDAPLPQGGDIPLPAAPVPAQQ